MGSYDRLAFVNFTNDVDAVAAFDANVVVVFHDMQASIKPLSSGRDYSNIFVAFSLNSYIFEIFLSKLSVIVLNNCRNWHS